MPRRPGDGLGHTRARRRAQEAAVWGLVADAVAEAHEAHAAARCDLEGSARAFLNETALPAVRALNGAGAPTLLLAMHRIVNAVQPGLISPEAALYGHWMGWRESNRSGRPLSMGDTLRLTGAGSAMSLRSSAPALLHALRTRYPGDAAPYLNQERATYPGGVSELDAALHLLHPPDEDLEVGEVTVFVEGAARRPPAPGRPTRCTTAPGLPPRTPSSTRRSPGSPLGAPPSRRRRTHPAAGLTQTCPPPSPGPGVPTTGGRSSGRSALAPPCSSSSSRPAGTRGGFWGSPPPASMGQHPYPAPPSRRPRRGTEYTPSCEHRRSPPLRGPTWCGCPRHRSTTPGGPGPWAPPQTGSCGATRGPRGSPASPPKASGWPQAPGRAGADATAGPPPPPPLPPAEHHTALPTARH